MRYHDDSPANSEDTSLNKDLAAYSQDSMQI